MGSCVGHFKITIDTSDVILAASHSRHLLDFVLAAMKYGDPGYFSQVLNIMPVNLLICPTGDESRPYVRLVELFVDEKVWDEACVNILLKSDRLIKEVPDNNNFLHQIAIHYKP
jgi:hypothetical protein